MKKIASMLVPLLMAALPAFSEHVTVQTAQRAAQSFLNSKKESNPQIHLIDFAEKAEFSNFYVFGNERCYVIIAADDAVHPVLGYSTENGFGSDAMGEEVRDWLKQYDKQIVMVREMRLNASEKIRTSWNNLINGRGLEPISRSSVKPLIKTQWAQDAPYNALCPNNCPAGCVAVAMAQIMNYWKNPTKGIGCHHYTPETHPEFGEQSAFFGITTYDWDNMPNNINNYSPQEEIEAVSTLIYHCGVSVDTDYSFKGSNATSFSVADALQTFFNYDSLLFIDYLSLQDDSTNFSVNSEMSWISLLKNDLNASRPVYYFNLATPSHAFICDGYDENDSFHFNWGWGGIADGYFRIGKLNPNIYDFSINNAAIFGCVPNINPPTEFISSTYDRNVTLYWTSNTKADSYNVYRNGSIIASNVENTTFIDCNLLDGIYLYYVTCNYYGKESAPSECISITIGNPDIFARQIDNKIIIPDVGCEATLQIFDINGKKLSCDSFRDSYEKELALSPGIYILRLTKHKKVVDVETGYAYYSINSTIKTQKIIIK